MPNRNQSTALVAVLTLSISACSGSATTTTVAPVVTASSATTLTTLAPPPATTAPSTTIAPTTLPEGTVGNPAALQALAEQLAIDNLIPIDEFFIPDITQPDPVGALKELLAYSDWTVTTFPDKSLAQIHSMEGSPARAAERSLLDTLEGFDLVIRPITPPVSGDYQIVSLDELPLTKSIRAAVPERAVALSFLSTADGYEYVNVSTGEVVESFAPWTDRLFYVVIAPTGFGWQEFWYGNP